MPSERPGNPIIRPPYQRLQRPKPKPRPKPRPAPPARSDVRSSGPGGYNHPKPPPRRPAPPARSDVASTGGYNNQEVVDQPKEIKKKNPPIFTDVRTSGPRPYQPQPPHPKLQHYGINRSLDDFNDLLDVANNHFQAKYNRPPSPGLLFDLARSPMTPFDVGKLFDVPDSDTLAKARGDNRRSGFGPTPPVTDDPFLNDVHQAVLHGTFTKFVETHTKVINEYIHDKKDAKKFLDIVYRAQGGRILATGSFLGPQTMLQKLGLEADRKIAREEQAKQFVQEHKVEAERSGMSAALSSSQLYPDRITGGPRRKPDEAGAKYNKELQISGASPVAMGEVIMRPVSQITQSLVFAPYGVFTLLNAFRKDAQDVFERGDFSPDATEKLVKSIAHSTWETYRHPFENPGYILMDAFALGTGGAGAVARVAAAGKALRAGPIAITKALVKRPLPGTYTLHIGGAEEQALLSDNSLVRAAQRIAFSKKQKLADIRHESGHPYPSGLLAVVMPDSAYAFVAKNFSFETKMGRLAMARRRTELVLAEEVRRELMDVAGHSINQSRVFSRLPKHARTGLTRGEQKAIQVLSTDDPNPLQTMRTFHENMLARGIGDPKAHRRQLADLKLAEKVLNDPKPRKRFTKAVEETRAVVAAMERIKIEELGLSPVTAESRVAAFGQVLRGEELFPGQRLRPDSFYLPTLSRAHSKRQARYAFGGARSGPLGVPPPRTPPELKHIFTGKAIMAGDIRIDATGLAGEAYGRTVRAASLWNDYKRLRAASKATPTSPFDVPIRDTQKIPKKLRDTMAKIDEGELTAADAANLHPDDLKSLIEYLYPKESENIPGVRWVDERLIGEAHKVPAVPGAGIKAFQAVNEPARVGTLFLRPAYVLNMVGNQTMQMMQQLFNPPNLMRAVFGHHLYGKKNIHTIDALMGEGRSRSYIAPEVTKLTKASQGLASAWSVITDRHWRRSSFIYWARRYGFKSEKQMDALLHDPKNLKRLEEIKRRGNKDMVEFDNLTWYEKNYLRHAIFVYPWVSRSLVWSLRTLVEHPIKTDVLVKLGHEAHENEDPVFNKAPEWFKKIGYFPVSWNDDGTPNVVNPTSINTFSGVSQLLDVANAGFVNDVPYSSLEELLGPGAKFGIHAITGRDEFGNEYPGSDVWNSFLEVYTGTPQALAYERAHRKNPRPSKIDITDRETLVKREHSMLHRIVFGPGWLDGYGTLIGGGLVPRAFDPKAAAARYWQKQPLVDRHNHEMGLIRKALDMQGKFLDRPVSPMVRSAVEFSGQLALAKSQQAKKLGRDPTQRESLELEIRLLANKKHINRIEEKKLLGALDKLDRTELDSFYYALKQRAPGTEALREWDSDVRLLYSFRKKVLDEKIDALKRSGLFKEKVTASQKQMFAYGRKYIEYQKEIKRLKDRADHAAKVSPDDLDAVFAEMRVWEQKHDRIQEGALPSLVRLAWAYNSPKEQARTLLYHATKVPWEWLSNFDKELLGKKPNATVAEGYAEVAKLIAKEIKASPDNKLPGWKRREQLYKYADRYYPGLWEDFQFGEKPLAARLSVMKLGQSSDMKDLLRNAATYSKWQKVKDVGYSRMKRGWLNYVNTTVMPYLQSHPNLAAEIDTYGGPSFLSSLVEG